MPSSPLLLDEAARAYYFDRPIEFVEDQIIAGRKNIDGTFVEIHPTQREILEAVKDGKFPVVPAGRGVGKTALEAWLIWWWIYCSPTAKCVVNSVKKEQLADNLWPELHKWMVGSAIQADLQWEKTKVYVKGRESTNFAVARTGAVVEGLQGYHDNYLLLLIEEASSLNDETYDSFLGSLTAKGGRNVIGLFGNPRRRDGPFAKNILKPSERIALIHIPCIDLDGKIHPCVRPGYVEEMRERYGETSNQYRVNVLGLLPESDEDAIIPREWVEQAALKEDQPEPDKHFAIKWGLDVATYGADASALVKRQGPLVIEVPQRRRQLSTMQNVAWIQDEYAATPRHLRPVAIYVDTIGVGAGVAERLADTGLPITGIAVSRRPADSKRFMRLRDELWWRMRLWFEKRNAYIPDDSDLIEELATPHYRLDNGKVKIESKDEMRDRVPKLGSPDTADALMLTFAEPDDLAPAALVDDAWERKSKSEPLKTTWMAE